jgi:hypothetical protein
MGIKERIKKIIDLRPTNQSNNNGQDTDVIPKTWALSQEYEWSATTQFMSTAAFKELATEAVTNENLKISNGFAPELTLKEFFGGSEVSWRQFTSHIEGKRCLEIGSCTSSILSSWDTASDRIVIEPLAERVSKWQMENLGFSLYEGLTTHSIGADEYLPALKNQIDGAIYCRNCIDHSPNWMFILSNISSYAAPGCKLLLWNDIYHVNGTDSGHYDLTQDPAAMKRLIHALGFDIIREYIDQEREDLNWGCYASKRV